MKLTYKVVEAALRLRGCRFIKTKYGWLRHAAPVYKRRSNFLARSWVTHSGGALDNVWDEESHDLLAGYAWDMAHRAD